VYPLDDRLEVSDPLTILLEFQLDAPEMAEHVEHLRVHELQLELEP
jgi:hypothetical protein